ncbi:DUF4157 domain-containing protein [Streptosporangiaceae bacterium NEAU-GS5]|nr:DUF4157 domain-containing protein [Streptosporangiaceae bacterium NEAU-GS5]
MGASREPARPARAASSPQAGPPASPMRPSAVPPRGSLAEHSLARLVGGAEVSRVLAGPGRPLDGPTRTDMEARMGVDFSAVRIHDDGAARRSARSLGAAAYTSGDHIVLGGTPIGRRTLAHELAHVVQQRAGPVAGVDGGDGLRISHPSDAFERAADAAATQALAGSFTPPQVAATSSAAPGAIAVQRALGFEIEIAVPVRDQAGLPFKETTPLADAGTEFRFKLTTDIRHTDDDLLGPEGYYSNVEIVTEPIEIVGLGNENWGRAFGQLLARLKQVRNALYAVPEDRPVAPLTDLLQETDLRPTVAGTTAQVVGLVPDDPVFDANEGGDLTVHYTVGLPLEGIPGFFDWLRRDDNTRKAEDDPRPYIYLQLAPKFAADLSAGYATWAERTGEADVPTADERLAFEGYAQLAYLQIAALASRFSAGNERNPEHILQKNRTAVLSRSALNGVRLLLADTYQRFFTANSDENLSQIEAFSKGFEQLLDAEFQGLLPSAHARDVLDYARALFGADPLNAPGQPAFRPFGQQKVFGGLTEVDPHLVGGVPLIPLELRFFRNVQDTWSSLRESLGAIIVHAQSAYGKGRPRR